MGEPLCPIPGGHVVGDEGDAYVNGPVRHTELTNEVRRQPLRLCSVACDSENIRRIEGGDDGGVRERAHLLFQLDESWLNANGADEVGVPLRCAVSNDGLTKVEMSRATFPQSLSTLTCEEQQLTY